MADPSDSPSPSDAELLERYWAGEEEAFAALVHRYQRELFSFLFRLTGSPALAEDAFQETFLQVHLSGRMFDVSRPLRPWLFTIAANKARDLLRSRQRRPAVSLDASLAGPDGEETTFLSLLPADVPAPDESLSNLETRRAVQTIVERMPESLRTVLVLGYFHEFPYQEIAEILSVPLGTVKSRLHAAVQHFAAEWKAAAERMGHGRTESKG